MKIKEPIPEFPDDPVDARAATAVADRLHEAALRERVLRFRAIGYAESLCAAN